MYSIKIVKNIVEERRKRWNTMKNPKRINTYLNKETVDNIVSDDLLSELNDILEDIPKVEEDPEPIKRSAKLHHWYLDKLTWADGTEGCRARGNVTGHYRLKDTEFIHTSGVRSVEVNRETEEVIIQTYNTEYHCLLSECDFSHKDTYELIPFLTEYSEKYTKENKYDQEDNSILIVLSDHEQYYFETAVIKEEGKTYIGTMHPHIGTFQDSCLLYFDEYDEEHGYEKHIDIRYFPHSQHLETYSWCTEALPVYLENTGEGKIFYTTYEGVIELKPGDRKLVCKENAINEDEEPFLDCSDLYPAVLLGHVDIKEENGILIITDKPADGDKNEI